MLHTPPALQFGDFPSTPQPHRCQVSALFSADARSRYKNRLFAATVDLSGGRPEVIYFVPVTTPAEGCLCVLRDKAYLVGDTNALRTKAGLTEIQRTAIRNADAEEIFKTGVIHLSFPFGKPA